MSNVSPHRSVVSKAQERIFAEEAAKLLAANWELIDIPEPPDFEIRNDDETFGLEIRQVFVDVETTHGSPLKKREADRQSVLRALAQKYYAEGGEPLHVKVLGALRNNDVDGIVEVLVRSRPKYVGPESLTNDAEVRVGSSKFFLKPLPDSFGNYSCWISIDNHVGWVKEIKAEDLQPAVDRKARQLPAYAAKYGKTILLLVADRRYRSGKLASCASVVLQNPGFHAIYFMSRLEFIARVG